MQVIGICRFSYPAIGGFQIEHDQIADRIAHLYDDARLEERFRLFETVALPCLRAQTDPHFGLIIVIGDQFPQHYRHRLEALIADLPQAIIHAEPPRKQREVMKEILNEARIDKEDPCLQFRFDDDDAVAVDFVEKLRAAAKIGAPLLTDNRTVAFDWNRGYAARFGAEGIAATELYRPYFVAALGMLIRGKCWQTIMNFGHEKIPRFMPTMSFSNPGMYVRGINSSNDSRRATTNDPLLTRLDSAEEAAFKNRFAIEADEVRRVFSAS
ncbi:putative rhamnosyl transferase [Sulfitobacter aestuariivivens]|uniref:Rhamnosyl transferase n=1 Tax=Sulfitobacter aestuariivivens TaxID=2766981 RepID=A0A927D6S9_9RHOB|nr:putative rhamnosyl transferase [Sulfitobacter aestuariivivens]MBD3665974.1 putative rhamnosyl transferase [Sulfitobacter aestuariivivens]